MRVRIVFTFAAALSFVTGTAAQTRITGTSKCAKPEAQHSVEVGDRPGHALSIHKTRCKWEKALEIGGVVALEDVITGSSEVRADGSRDNGNVVASMANGDKLFVRFEGATAAKDRLPVGSQGTWMYTGGTGRFRGIKGKGTFKGKPNADGSWSNDVEGEYTLPSAAPAKK